MEVFDNKKHGPDAQIVAMASSAIAESALHTMEMAFNMHGAVMCIAVSGDQTQDAVSSFHCSVVVEEQTAEWYRLLAQFLRMRANECDEKAAFAGIDTAKGAAN